MSWLQTRRLVSVWCILALLPPLHFLLPPSTVIQTVEAAEDAAELEYQVDIGPVTGSVSANYVYGTIFNPSSSGRTLVLKQISVRSDAVAAATYVNLTVRRITAATAGTSLAAGDIPRKNTDSLNPVAEVRHSIPSGNVTFSGSTDSRLLGQPQAGTTNVFYSQRNITFGSSDEKIVLQEGEGIALYQEAAGDADQRIRMTLVWEEVVSAPSFGDEYMMALPRVENAAAANYVYNSFFNPSGSTKTAVVKRIWFGSETCDAAAVYTNNLVLRRTTAASAGTQVTAANIPKKHTGSGNSVVEIRHTNVTVTVAGGTDARLGHVTPCGTTGQSSGWQELNFYTGDEQLILQPGEGIALMSDAAGDVDQLNRMFVEWDEVASAPTADNHYLWASSRVENVATTLGTTMYTYFNPSGSGKTMLVKRIGVRNDADTTATYSAYNFQRITAASGGTSIAATDLPKKHTGSGASAMEVRWCGATCATAITATYSGSRSTAANGISDSGILKVNGAGTLGQVIGQREIVFSENEPFVLKEGEGIGFYLNYLAGDLDHYTKVFVEWEEVASAPTTQNQYLIDIGPVPGNTGTSYNYATFFNPAASAKTVLIKRVSARVDTVAAAVYIPMRLRYISAASAGTQVTAANIPKKHTSSANSAVEIRRSGVTATFSQTADGQLMTLRTPGAVAAATAPSVTGYKELLFTNDENIILQPGEGIALHHDTSAGSANFRVKFLVEWEEVDKASTPTALENHIFSSGSVPGSTALDYVYSTMYNPVGSEKTYVIQRLGIRADRTGTVTAPGDLPLSIRRVTSASAGTLVDVDDVPKKHASSSTTTAEFRNGGVTVTLDQVASSRLLGATTPSVVNRFSDYETEVYGGDEIILLPGEGIALYQEAAAGDTNMQYSLSVAWKEINGPVIPTLTFSISDTSVGFGPLITGGSRYATGDILGSGSDSTSAHTISVSTNAADGYSVTLDGSTLTCAACGGATITAIGGTAVAASTGSEQFGLRATVESGNGTVSSPYNGADWALDTTAFPDVIATGAGDEVTSVFGFRYIGNIATLSEAGSYNAVINYSVTASF